RAACVRSRRGVAACARRGVQRVLHGVARVGAEGLAAGGQRLGARALRADGVIATVVQSAQQKDNLCGPFWAARVLGADEDEIALRAGTILPDPDEGSVPPGAESKTDYTVELPTGPPEVSGTSAQGLLEAIEATAAECIPLRGPWTEERVAGLHAEK